MGEIASTWGLYAGSCGEKKYFALNLVLHNSNTLLSAYKFYSKIYIWFKYSVFFEVPDMPIHVQLVYLVPVSICNSCKSTHNEPIFLFFSFKGKHLNYFFHIFILPPLWWCWRWGWVEGGGGERG